MPHCMHHLSPFINSYTSLWKASLYCYNLRSHCIILIVSTCFLPEDEYCWHHKSNWCALIMNFNANKMLTDDVMQCFSFYNLIQDLWVLHKNRLFFENVWAQVSLLIQRRTSTAFDGKKTMSHTPTLPAIHSAVDQLGIRPTGKSSDDLPLNQRWGQNGMYKAPRPK